MDTICDSCKREESMVVGAIVDCPRAVRHAANCFGDGKTYSGWYRHCCEKCSLVLNQCQMCGKRVSVVEPRGKLRRYRVTFRRNRQHSFWCEEFDSRSLAGVHRAAAQYLQSQPTAALEEWLIVDTYNSQVVWVAPDTPNEPWPYLG